VVNPRDFGGGQSAIWRKTLVWRRELREYGQMMTELATTDRGNPRWHKLLHDTSMLAHNLAQRGARAEVEAEKASG